MSPSASGRLDPLTAVGPVSLIARDRDALSRWWQAALGLAVLAEDGRATVLGGPDGTPLLTLVADPSAAVAERRQPGLFHIAILLPTRADLGRWLRHAASIGIQLEGASDHLVSEAVYLSDPEGNGIEVYRDRARPDWPRVNGRVHMDNSPFDAAGVLSDGDRAALPWMGIPAGTVVGHVHLKVKDIRASRTFYEGLVGFDVTEEGYNQALFVAAGGYHHHFGLNTWTSAGRDRRPGVTGLDAATITLPEGAAAPVVARLREAGVEIGGRGGHPAVIDPSGNRLVLVEGQMTAAAALDAAA